tara:strand:- start:124 stop:225 length:102 start_codon:yes stop_codon:yes gene_type:complete
MKKNNKTEAPVIEAKIEAPATRATRTRKGNSKK